MSKGNEPAYPAFVKGRQGFANVPTVQDKQYPGLTKRELFAAMAMQGLLANPEAFSTQDIAEQAVTEADALLAELERSA